MKKFTIIHNFTATVSIEVLAETREEAFEKASKNNIDPRDYDFELDSAEIGHEEEVPDLKSLIKEAEDILKQSDSIELDSWPIVTILVWNGEEMEPIREIIENIYWDEEREEIGFETDRCSELTISDILEIEQFELCKAIIEQND